MTIREYELIRSKRKTISITIKRDLTVVVRVPARMSAAAADGFVRKNEEWIQKHLEEMGQEAKKREEFAFKDGQRIPYLGRDVRLVTGDGPLPEMDGEWLFLPRDGREKAVAEFLRAKTREMVLSRIETLAPVMGVTPAGVKITSAATRWGSCSGRNSLCFSYRIACLPVPLLDYIVVHELAHIREHNHSARFWAVVDAVLPDYRERRAALREFQKRIPF